jgi:hypothetical protein
MIKILLDPSVFTFGGIFYGRPLAHAVLNIGSSKPFGEGYVAKNAPIYGTQSQLWRGGETQLNIDAWGTEIQDLALQDFMQNESLRVQFGMVLIDLVGKGLIQVQQNGTALTPTELSTFTA